MLDKNKLCLTESFFVKSHTIMTARRCLFKLVTHVSMHECLCSDRNRKRSAKPYSTDRIQSPEDADNVLAFQQQKL